MTPSPLSIILREKNGVKSVCLWSYRVSFELPKFTKAIEIILGFTHLFDNRTLYKIKAATENDKRGRRSLWLLSCN